MKVVSRSESKEQEWNMLKSEDYCEGDYAMNDVGTYFINTPHGWVCIAGSSAAPLGECFDMIEDACEVNAKDLILSIP